MKEYRAYFFVALLILAALVTPPDIITQTLIVLPVMGLYQISIYLVDRIEPV
jgi:sec-independent protein translocase protein TatC